MANYPPESTRILLLGLIARKAYRLVTQNVIRTVKQVLTFNDLIVEMRLLSDDKERVDDVDSVQSVPSLAFRKDAHWNKLRQRSLAAESNA